VASAPPLIGIVGWKNSGKTTLIERLVAALARDGLSVATIKHTHHELRAHDGVTDGERHARAGAVRSAVISPSGWELAGELRSGPAPALEQVVELLGAADLVLVEGFKGASIPKIELRREASPTKRSVGTARPQRHRDRRRSRRRRRRPPRHFTR
jgi:molybdopterin-guanine dinucleotide biosynthesis protein B